LVGETVVGMMEGGAGQFLFDSESFDCFPQADGGVR
jgi:hypothetical protein